MKTDTPVFLYSMVPVETTSYRKFFERGPLWEVLEKPGQLRYAGWDLTTHGQPRIVKGEYLELTSAERKRIRVYEDGSVFVRVSADQDYLSWGLNDAQFKEMPRLNTLAVIEFTLNFCKFCSGLVVHMDPEPSQVELTIEIRNAFLGESKLFLIPHAVSTNWFRYTDDRHSAPAPSANRRIRVPIEQLKSRPDVVAFLLTQRLFLWFGLTPDRIPYASADGDLKFIDELQIKTSRS
jgi:hypothetical protein